VAGGFAVWKPDLVLILLKRQALQDVEIPRWGVGGNITQKVWPTDRGGFRIRVGGEFTDDMNGSVLIRPDGQSEFRRPLEFAGRQPDGTAVYEAKLPAASVGFSLLARVGDGRMRKPAGGLRAAAGGEGNRRLAAPARLQGYPTPLVRGWSGGRCSSSSSASGFRGGSGGRCSSSGSTSTSVPAARRHRGRAAAVRVRVWPVQQAGEEGVADRHRAHPNSVAAITGAWARARGPLEPSTTRSRRSRWRRTATRPVGAADVPRLIGYKIDLEDDRDFKSRASARRGCGCCRTSRRRWPFCPSRSQPGPDRGRRQGPATPTLLDAAVAAGQKERRRATPTATYGDLRGPLGDGIDRVNLATG